MADPEKKLNIFTRTEPEIPTWPEDNTDLDGGILSVSGVALTPGEFAAVDAICKKFNITRNKFIRLATRRLILDFRAGRFEFENGIVEESSEITRKPKNKVKMPNK